MLNQNEAIEFLQSRLPENLTAGITGNVSLEIKEIPLKWLAIFRNKGKGFSGKISRRLRVVDVSVVPNPDDHSKMEARVTTEIDVTPDMCNAQGILEKGCIVFLIDECSTTAMVVISAYNNLHNPPGVSQTINTLFHSEAIVGMRLRIVNRSLESGNDVNSGKTEIWDMENHRLVASGTQITMLPSVPAKWLGD